jgi:UDPglucose 6-dehydrogenase
MKNGNSHSKSRVGVIGLGAVGKTLAHTLSWFHDVVPYDIKGSYDWERILSTDLALICVDTPLGSDGRLNCSNVNDVLNRLQKGGYARTIGIRSTVRVGFMTQAAVTHPKLRLVYFPEFIRERSRLQWTVCPDRLVLAGEERDVRVILSAFDWVEDAPTLRMSFLEAELGKLAHNAFIATKVSFTNEIERICQSYDADPEKVLQVVTVDRRVLSREHLRPNRGPYNGSCVPKDTHELMVAGGGAPLLAAVEQVKESFVYDAHHPEKHAQPTGQLRARPIDELA